MAPVVVPEHCICLPATSTAGPPTHTSPGAQIGPVSVVPPGGEGALSSGGEGALPGGEGALPGGKGGEGGDGAEEAGGMPTSVPPSFAAQKPVAGDPHCARLPQSPSLLHTPRADIM